MSWSTPELRVRLALLNQFKPASKIFYWPFQGGTSFVDLLCFCSVLCLLCLCARLFICALWSSAGKGLTSWLSSVVVCCEFVTFPLVPWVRCGTWLYRFLIFAALLTLHKLWTPYAFPLSINLSLMKYWCQKIIILDAKTSNLPTRKLQQVNAYMYGTRYTFKKDIWLHFNCEIYFSVHVFYTCKLVKCHHAAFH